MKCPTCGATVTALACEPCTARRAATGLRGGQHFYLDDLAQGRIRFFAMRESNLHPWHLALFGDRTRAWCGEEVLRPGPKNRCFWSYRDTRGEEARTLCPKCLDELHKVEEAHAIREES